MFATMNLSQKIQSMEWKYTGSLAKEKFWGQGSVNKVILTIFWDMRAPIIIGLFEKEATVLGAFHCKLLHTKIRISDKSSL